MTMAFPAAWKNETDECNPLTRPDISWSEGALRRQIDIMRTRIETLEAWLDQKRFEYVELWKENQQLKKELEQHNGDTNNRK